MNVLGVEMYCQVKGRDMMGMLDFFTPKAATFRERLLSCGATLENELYGIYSYEERKS